MGQRETYLKRHTRPSPAGQAIITTSLALLLALALIPAPASAITTHLLLPFSPITGSGTNVTLHGPSGIAVDETSGNVFLADGTENGNVVDILGAEGGVPAGLGSPYKLTGFKFNFEPSGIAVDNSVTSSSKGTLYVVDVKNNAVKKFTLNGGTEKYEAAGQLAPTSGPGLGEPLGAALDSKGNVFVADHDSSSIVEFSPTGTQLARIDTSGTVGNPSSLALDSAGDLFVQGYLDGSVYKYPANGSGEIEEAVFTQVVASGATGVAVDTSVANALYVARGNRIDRYDATSLALEGEFGTGKFTTTERLVVNSTNGRIYVADRGAHTIVVFSPLITVPEATAAPASALALTTATVNGSVKPDGVTLTECKFEYGLTTSYGSSRPCSQALGSIPSDTSFHPVSTDLTGLTGDTTYHFHLVAANANGTISSPDETFITLGPPLISEQSAAPLGTHDGLLRGHINPSGAATNYHFEWGTGDSYGHQIPVQSEPSIGSGTSPIEVGGNLSGLEEDTTYHYHLVASNEFGTTEGPDQTFSTKVAVSCPNAVLRAGQTSSTLPDGSTYLPGCMALEMVSPPQKYNQAANQPAFSVSGDQVRFISLAALAETLRQNFEDPYVAVRGASGWITHATAPPPSISGNLGTETCAYSNDLSHRAEFVSNETQAKSGIGTVYLSNFGGVLYPLSPTLTPIISGTSSARICEGGAADASAIFFGVPDVAYLPGDPASASNIYEAHLGEKGNPSVELLTRDKDGKVYGGACGAHVGWAYGSAFPVYRGSISPDASRVYFTTWPSQPEGASCDAGNNKMRVMKRLQTPVGPVISEVSASECTRVSPPCDPNDYDDNFKGSSQEGDRVFFTTARQLANSDLDTAVGGGGECKFGENRYAENGKEAGCDLYLYDASLPPGARLIQVSAGDATDPTPGRGAETLGLAAFAGDGSHAYFQATGVLTTTPNAQGRAAEAGRPNLYLYERDAAHPGGRIAFVATLKPREELNASAVPLLGVNPEDRWVGGDGHILVFTTSAALTPDDTDGGEADIYRYDSDTGSLQRISRSAPGGADNGAFGAFGGRLGGEAVPRDVSFGRQVSEDGRTIVFATAEALDPSDTDGSYTSYVWHDGLVAAITDSDGTITTSTSGEELAFVSDSQLLPEDGDNTKDVYVARTNGGFPPLAPTSALCEGEACQGPPRPQPVGQGATSNFFVGPGNSESKPRKRRKHSKHRQHKKRAVHGLGGKK